MPQLRLHRAAVDDAAGIAHVHIQSWRETYAGWLPAELLAGLAEEPRATRWAAIINEGASEVVVAEVDARIIGWASAGEGRDEDAPARRELEGIYVLGEAHGTGVGQQLLEAVLGEGSAYLWVLDGNPRAEAFYRKNGFIRDGAAREERLAGHPVPVVRMVRG